MPDPGDSLKRADLQIFEFLSVEVVGLKVEIAL
jgi:hypothetical protein